MISVEIGEPFLRCRLFDRHLNEESMLTSLDLVQELRDQVRIREEASKLRAQHRYNTKFKPRSFHQGDLVWRMASAARKHERKFSPNWEGPFRINEAVGNDAYRLEHLSGAPVPATWNASHLKFYYS